MRRTAVFGILFAAAALIGAACVPDPAPSGPKWAATVLDWNDTGGPGHSFAGTTEDWWAAVEVHEGYSSATLHLHRRTGSRKAPEGTPSFSFPLDGGALGLAMSDHLVAVRSFTPAGDQLPIELFEREGDTWVPAGTVNRPIPAGASLGAWPAMDLTDDHLVVGEQGNSTGPMTDGQVAVVPIDREGPGLSVGSPTILQPDAAWSADARSRFGSGVSVVGDLLAVSTAWDRLAIYSHGPGGWSVEDVLEDSGLGSDARFARTISLDGGGSPRIAVGSSGGWVFGAPQPGRVEVYELLGGTWTVTHTIGPRDGSALAGMSMGSHVALDGTRLVVSGHWHPVQRPDGEGTVADLRLEVHNLSTTPTFRDELSVYSALGGVDAHPTASMVGALDLDLAGNHVSVSAHASFGSDPAGLAAMSFDHR